MGSLTRPQVYTATEVAINARGSSAPGARRLVPDSGRDSMSLSRPVQPLMRNIQAPQKPGRKNFADFLRTPGQVNVALTCHEADQL